MHTNITKKVNGKVASVSIQQCLSYYRNCHLDIGSNHHWGPANTGRSLHCPLHLDETKKTREKVSLTSQHFFLLCNYKWFLFLFRFQSPNWDRIASIINPAYAPQINEPEPVSIKIQLFCFFLFESSLRTKWRLTSYSACFRFLYGSCNLRDLRRLK